VLADGDVAVALDPGARSAAVIAELWQIVRELLGAEIRA
jgi:hypothetical protein